MKWQIQHKITQTTTEKRQAEIIQALLQNRGLDSQEKRDIFLNPINPLKIDLEKTGIEVAAAQKAAEHIFKAIKEKTQIVIYGDYDADGITATAILWETLFAMGAKVVPFIPHRQVHGYGLSIAGLEEIIQEFDPGLVITVDNGIVAHEAADYLAEKEIDLIITDHHQKSEQIPNCLALVHSTQIAGSAVAWFFAKYLLEQNDKPLSKDISPQDTLDLVAIGTIADLMSMKEINRSLAKFGLIELTTTKRPGLQALKEEAEIEPGTIMSAYHVGFVIGPRINAMGRIDHGMDALRLLCTHKEEAARQLAHVLASTNKDRQDLTQSSVDIAIELYEQTPMTDHLIIIDHDGFHEGVIGLIAGKLSEKYYKPSIVISREGERSKASARSVEGINIIDLIRTQMDFLTNAGGHPGAAGFSLPTENIADFRQALIAHANQVIDETLLEKTLFLEAEIGLQDVSLDLFDLISDLEPFGVGNKKPLFALEVLPLDMRTVGRENKHLKLKLGDPENQLPPVDAIAFNLGELLPELSPNQPVMAAGYVDKNEWNGKISVQVIVKQIKV